MVNVVLSDTRPTNYKGGSQPTPNTHLKWTRSAGPKPLRDDWPNPNNASMNSVMERCDWRLLHDPRFKIKPIKKQRRCVDVSDAESTKRFQCLKGHVTPHAGEYDRLNAQRVLIGRD